MKMYQKVGLQSFVQKIRFLKLFSNKLHELSFMALEIKDRKLKINSNPVVDKKNIKIGIVTGCVQDVFFRDVNMDTAEVFKINGYDVFIPLDQQCCGSVHGHNGDLKTAKSLAKKMIDIFDKAGVSPDQIRTIKDLEKLPITRKTNLIELQRAKSPYGGFLAIPPEDVDRIFLSPGPVYEPIQHAGIKWFAKSFYAAGFRKGDVVINTFTYHMSPAGILFHEALRDCGATAVPMGTGNTETK